MIREIVPNDLEGLLRLYLHLKGNTMPEIGTTEIEIWDSIIMNRDHHVIVADVDGKDVSTCTLLIVRNLTQGRRPYGLIENVVTDPEYRRKGLAGDCIRYAMEIATSENCYKVMLMTGSKDPKVLGFYEGLGFNRNDKTAFIRWLDHPGGI